MPPAARLTDMHTCPMVTPGTPPVPHVGGPILPPCCPTVMIGMLPAARVTDMAVCVGPPDSIAMGSPTVLLGNLMAARLGDPTVHGGVIVQGEPTVMIGIPGAGAPLTVAPGASGLGAAGFDLWGAMAKGAVIGDAIAAALAAGRAAVESVNDALLAAGEAARALVQIGET